jgi:hypothetical protein
MIRFHLLILMATILFSTVVGCPPRSPQPIVRHGGEVEGIHGADIRPSSAGLEK